MTLDD